MSEPLGVEERARLRTLAENREQIFPSQVLSLLDEVDRLTEALEAAEKTRIIEYRHTPDCDWVTNFSACNCGMDEAWIEAVKTEAVQAADALMERAERAEADLADEKRRHAAEIAAAEQRGREDNADHGQCYVHGSKALAALIAEARAEAAAELRAGVEALGKRWAASDDRGWVSNQADELLDLLDTATEETP